MPPLGWKKKRYGPRASTKAYATKVIDTLKTKVNRLTAAIDKKRKDNVAAGTIDYNGAINPVSATIQGDTFTDRDASEIKVTSLIFRGEWTIPSGNMNMRTIVFQDSSNQGTPPTVADVLNVTGSARAPNSPYVFEQKSRFKILADKRYALSSNNDKIHPFKISISGDKLAKVHYTGSGSTPLKGAIYLLNISDQTGAALPAINVDWEMNFEG